MISAGSTTRNESRGLYLANMAALWRMNGHLAAQIDAVMDDQRLERMPTKSGDWTVTMPNPQGRPCYLHSRYDPTRETAKLVESIDFEKQHCVVLNGFGLGYPVRAIFDRLKGEAVLVVFEPSAEVLASALTCVDLSDAISSGRLIIINNLDKAALHQTLRPFNALIMLGAQFATHAPSEQIAGPFHAAARKLFTEFVAYTRTALVTLVANAEITCRNIACNLPAYVSTPPISILRGRFQGVPAIIVSAGPSLRKNIDLLHEVQGKAIIVAVQTTYRPLLQRGIRPDFVVSLDYHEVSRQFFEGVAPSGDVHLIVEPKATWHVVDGFNGPVSLLDSSFARLLLGNELAARDGLPPGATVAHLAFYVARYIGCDPIIFVGQDLAYTGNVFYLPGVEIHQTWRSEINRFNTMEMKEWERIIRNREILRKVKDIEGNELYADELLTTYLEQFEKDFTGTEARLIDATEGGALIRGTQPLTLRETIDRFCRDPIPPDRFAYRRTVQWYDPSRLVPARMELVRRLEEIEMVGGICDEMLGLLDELKGLVRQPDRFNRRLARVDELRMILRGADRAYQIITSASQRAEFLRFKTDHSIKAAGGKDSAERALRQLDRDIEFVRSVREGVDIVSRILKESIARFDKSINEGEQT